MRVVKYKVIPWIHVDKDRTQQVADISGQRLNREGVSVRTEKSLEGAGRFLKVRPESPSAVSWADLAAIFQFTETDVDELTRRVEALSSRAADATGDIGGPRWFRHGGRRDCR